MSSYTIDDLPQWARALKGSFEQKDHHTFHFAFKHTRGGEDLVLHYSDILDFFDDLINENIINNTEDADNIISGGDALARYITRRVTLKDGFDATDLKVYITANRPANSRIFIYYKVLSQFDDSLFDDRPWVLMNVVGML